jgi:murein DD-endopeptidase MepM/ murein hydrolase activator NlpD
MKRTGRFGVAGVALVLATFAPATPVAATGSPMVGVVTLDPEDGTTTTSTSDPSSTTSTSDPADPTTTTSEPAPTTTGPTTPTTGPTTTTTEPTTTTTGPTTTEPPTTTTEPAPTTTTTEPRPPDLPDEEGDGGPPPAAPPVPPAAPDAGTGASGLDAQAIAARRKVISEQDAGHRTLVEAHLRAEADIRARIQTAESARAEAQLRVQAADGAVAEVEARIEALNEASERSVENLSEAKKRFDDMVLEAFQRGPDETTLLVAAAKGDGPNDIVAARSYARLMGEDNVEVAAEYTRLRERTKKDLVKLSDQLVSVQLEHENATDAQAAQTAALEEATADLAELGQVPEHPLAAAAGWRFPIAGKYNFVSSWGYPRSGGRSHKGNDLFAAWGTPAVAIERGVISKIGTNSLGGLIVWLQGESGNAYYYAHLSGYAPGLAVGQVVDSGSLVGYVGNTGNAITTPPHLHFEVHPRNGDAVDPYPLLRAIADADAAFPPPPTPFAPLAGSAEPVG